MFSVAWGVLAPWVRRVPFPAFLVCAACVIPTDRSGELRIEFLSAVPDPFIAGDTFRLAVRVLDVAGTEVPKIAVGFHTTDPSVVLVDSTGTARGFGRGSAYLVASLVDFAGSHADSQPVEVLAALPIDRIEPGVTRFGDIVGVLGFGLDPALIDQVTIGGVPAEIKGFAPADPADPNSRDTLRVSVPALVPPLSDVVVRRRDAAYIATIEVLQQDVYEPNESAPVPISIGFRDSALVLEPLQPVDWYRLVVPGDEPFTIRIPNVASRVALSQFELGVSNARRTLDSPPSWFISQIFVPDNSLVTLITPGNSCKNTGITGTRGGSLPMVALGNVPVDTIDIIVSGIRSEQTPLMAYQLEIAPGYQSALPPDEAEENDFCDVAYDLTVPGTHNLTFDNPWDLDWFRFRVDSAEHVVEFTITELIGVALILLTAEGDFIEGSGLNSITASLAPGSYLLLVTFAAAREYVLTSTTQPTSSPTARE